MKKMAWVAVALGIAVCLIAGYHLLRPDAPHSTAPKVATVQAAEHFTHDEAADLIAACGKPSSERQEATDAARGGEYRILDYRTTEFSFMRDGEGDTGWTMVIANRKGRNAAISKDEVVRTMPCIKQVNFSNDLF